uniref:Putative reverse transcriptase domain-containing protein n=1 Tax=Helianthus annuus TaxID=4232 RepID=A0A251SMQ5_HELAN
MAELPTVTSAGSFPRYSDIWEGNVNSTIAPAAAVASAASMGSASAPPAANVVGGSSITTLSVTAPVVTPLPHFDNTFLLRNADLLRQLQQQQQRDEMLQSLRTNLFTNSYSGGNPVSVGPFASGSLGSLGLNPQDQELFMPYHPTSMTSQSKFTLRIVNAPLPAKLKMPPTLKFYDGTSDPDDHMFAFAGAAKVEQWPMPAWCLMFAQTLTGSARVWFDGLPEGSIDHFEDFRRIFLQNFCQQRRCKKDITEVHHIKRRDGESVEDFIDRFNRESMQISGAVDQLRVSGFYHGVRNNQLVEKLHEDLPKTMEILMERARAFVRGKSACGQPNEANARSSKARTTSWRRNASPPKDRSSNWSKNRGPYQKPDRSSFRTGNVRFNSFSELSKSPSEILSTENTRFPTPSKQRPTSDKHSKKYCEYHRDKGHTTDECWALKQEIEKAVRSGKLSHLVKEVKDGKKPATAVDNPNTEPGINMIRSAEPRGIKRSNQHMAAWMLQPMYFPPIDPEDARDGPITISAVVAGHKVRRIYVDGGSAFEIMYIQCFQQLNPQTKRKLIEVSTPLISFSGEVVRPIGQITLPTTFKDGSKSRTVPLTFLVVRTHSSHNIILGRPGLRALGAISSTIHGAIKFPTEAGVATICSESNSLVAEVRHTAETSSKKSEVPTELWAINPDFPEQQVAIGAQLPKRTKKLLWELLSNSIDVFAWKPSDMHGVPRSMAQHHLNVKDSVKPITQRKRHMAPDRARAIAKDVKSLLDAGIIREVRYQTWVSNPVMVRKKDNSWRMCIDFTDLNNACPKDCFPLPEIDEKIDSVATFRLKCFLDAYKGYHQIQMAVEDEDKTAFVTNEGVFCFTKMPFGLKNAGATYQRLMNKAFKDQIERNVEVYVDDIVIKSHDEAAMIKDILETFTRLRSINMKLNPKKCTFGVEEGKFLGVMVGSKGLRANPDKIDAVLTMKPPASVKEIQSLNGRLAALHRFLSKAADRSLPFMDVLRKSFRSEFKWTEEATRAFEELKKCLGTLPTLTVPEEDEVLTVYLAASLGAISAVLVAHRTGKQIPIYYVSRTLKDYETRYSNLEKLALALVHASRRLRRYFQAHPIEVRTDQKIQHVLRRPEVSGRMAKWAIELGAFNITFRTKGPLKGQVIADFLVEIPEEKGTEEEDKAPEKPWSLYTDGASSAEGSGAGLILTDPDGTDVTYALRLEFKSSNNEAEYEALLAGLRLAQKVGAKNVIAHVDSLLVANQVNGEYEAREANMIEYLEQVKQMMAQFEACRVEHVPRSKNKKADALSKLASVSFSHLAKDVRVEVLATPSIATQQVMQVETPPHNWMTPIINYLVHDVLPTDKSEARKIQINSLQYQMQEGGLYRKTFLGPLLKCLDPDQANYIIREIHYGICGIHAGPKMIVTKVKNAGYYWPGMHESAVKELQQCDECQKHAPISLRAKNEMIPVTAAWPFQKWGVDIVGPFPRSSGSAQYLLVAVDYFTKWVEARPFTVISGYNVTRFFWEQIVCRFGLPLYIISDNAKQFAENPFKRWCENLKINQVFSSVAHPQGNGQVEQINRRIVDGIK